MKQFFIVPNRQSYSNKFPLFTMTNDMLNIFPGELGGWVGGENNNETKQETRTTTNDR